MAKLVYSAITSLDGYTADEGGNFEWAAPDAQVHAFVNDLERPIGTHLYGRRMYETMVYWETVETDEPVSRDFAEIWRAADKVVYSRTIDSVSSARTRLERAFDPLDVVHLKASAERDISIGGPDIARQAIAAGLVDEVHLFVTPIAVGGGTAALSTHAGSRLELRQVERFGSGVVYLRYDIHNG